MFRRFRPKMAYGKHRHGCSFNPRPYLGGGVPTIPRWFFLAAPHTVWDKELIFLYSCISHFSSDILKILSLYDLWLGRYDLVLKVMSGRIFIKFDIASKAQLWPEHFETCSVQYLYLHIWLYKLYISDLSYHWPQVRSISWPAHYKSMREKSSPSNIFQIASNRSEWLWI